MIDDLRIQKELLDVQIKNVRQKFLDKIDDNVEGLDSIKRVKDFHPHVKQMGEKKSLAELEAADARN